MARTYDSDADSSSSEESAHNSSDDYFDKPQQAGIKRKRAPNTVTRRKVKVAPKPTYVAQVTATATDGADTSENTSKIDNADSNVLAKIRKAMRLATHSGTSEAEAKAAMRMAKKLMQSQNLTQADLIANETVEERSTRAGQSTVTITSTNGKAVRRQRWYDTACNAACEAFDVQIYSEICGNSLDEVFYGLADNTVAAALSFEMLHNQIENWAIERKGKLKGPSAGNNYRYGVADRVLKDVQKENRKAVREAEEAEKKRLQEEAAAAEAMRAAEIARLAPPVVEPTSPVKEKLIKIEDILDEDERRPLADISGLAMHYDDDDDDDDDNDLLPNYEDGALMNDDMPVDFGENHEDDGDILDLDALELKIQVKSEPVDPLLSARGRSPPPLIVPMATAVKAEPEAVDTIKAEPSDDSVPSWSSAVQLRTFRDNAKAIAETYIKDAGMKLRKGPKRREMKYNHAAYTTGWNDGQKVDLKRRRIEGAEKA